MTCVSEMCITEIHLWIAEQKTAQPLVMKTACVGLLLAVFLCINVVSALQYLFHCKKAYAVDRGDKTYMDGAMDMASVCNADHATLSFRNQVVLFSTTLAWF